MAFDLRAFGPRIQEHAEEWDSLGLEWTVGPIHPNYGKALTSATFDGVEWLAQISIWETGETEVETVRKRDGQAINKHYDIANVTELDTVIVEVLLLLRDGEAPPDAFIG
jgi:hypothetical protein